MSRDQFVTHLGLAYFADERVNLKREDVATYRQQVNNLRDQLTAYINKHPDFKLIKMLHSGSVAKGTALKTINDMDVAVYVTKDSAPANENDLLVWLQARLQEAYGAVKSKDDFTIEHHCVKVKFHGTGLDVDVAPVLYENAANDIGYLVNKDGERVLTSIPMHLLFSRTRKELHGPDYRQLIRFIKSWKRQQADGFRFKSFMIELIVAHLFDRGLIQKNNYMDALEGFFKYVVQSQLKLQIVFADYYSADQIAVSNSPIRIFDPVNPANNVASQYTDQMRGTIVAAAAESLDALMYARNATTKAEAISVYKEIFGPSFKVSE